MVAPSFQKLEIVNGPYTVDGKAYVQVRGTNGKLRQCRWYTEKEYEKYYPPVRIIQPAKPQKEIFGFDKGYITLYKGVTADNEHFFKDSNVCWCNTFWDWFTYSHDEVPAVLPNGVEAVQLPWVSVGNPDGSLKSKAEVRAAADALLYPESPSKFQGKVGERLERTLEVFATYDYDSNYGLQRMHMMSDMDGNVYLWATASKMWEKGSTHHIKGTVKEHKIYRNCAETVLTRCMEV